MEWSQLPWAQVITGIVALWGAGLSTLLAVRQIRRDHYRIRVKVGPALITMTDGAAPAAVLFEVQNAGYRAAEIRAIYLRLPHKRKFAFPRIQSDSPLPHRLEEGGRLTAWIYAGELASALSANGYKGLIAVRAECTDALDKSYFSKPMDIDIDVLAKL
jgi:hypothetical protein